MTILNELLTSCFLVVSLTQINILDLEVEPWMQLAFGLHIIIFISHCNDLCMSRRYRVILVIYFVGIVETYLSVDYGKVLLIPTFFHTKYQELTADTWIKVCQLFGKCISFYEVTKTDLIVQNLFKLIRKSNSKALAFNFVNTHIWGCLASPTFFPFFGFDTLHNGEIC